MTVELNVVGIFYKQNVDIGLGNGADKTMSVKGVMDLAVKQSIDPLFRYSTVNHGMIVNSIMAYHLKDFLSRSQRKYPKGVYHLGQTFTNSPPNPYSVWQYYLFNETGQRVHVATETSYTESTVKDHWKIVWRLVTVCNSPTGLSHRMDKMLPAGSLPVDMF